MKVATLGFVRVVPGSEKCTRCGHRGDAHFNARDCRSTTLPCHRKRSGERCKCRDYKVRELEQTLSDGGTK